MEVRKPPPHFSPSNIESRLSLNGENLEQDSLQRQENLRKPNLSKLLKGNKVPFSVSIFDCEKKQNKLLFSRGSEISEEHIDALANANRHLVTISYEWKKRNNEVLAALESILHFLPPDCDSSLLAGEKNTLEVIGTLDSPEQKV